MGGGGGSCGAEGVNICGGWNACIGTKGWKDWGQWYGGGKALNCPKFWYFMT
jgi:hypothetical protein